MKRFLVLPLIILVALASCKKNDNGKELTESPELKSAKVSEVGDTFVKFKVAGVDQNGDATTKFVVVFPVQKEMGEVECEADDKGIIVVEGLTPNTAYFVGVFTKDRCNNISYNSEDINFTTSGPKIVTLGAVQGGTVKMYYKGAELKSGETVPQNSYVTVEAVADDNHLFSGINIYKGVAVRDSFKVTKDTTVVAEFTEVDVLPATDKYKVCNYNIRLYTDSDKKDKHWTNRRSYLFSMIQKHTMDVCGLEEMTPQQAPDFEKNMPDYEYVGYGRDNGKAYGAGSSGEQTGLVYNKRHFVKQDQGRFFLSNTPNKPSKVSGASFNRMVTWVKLKERKSDVIFYFFATHFDHPTNQTGINTRSKEADIALVEVPKIVGDNPMFFVGDFNCRPEEPAYQKLAAKWKDSFITMGDEAQGGYVCNDAQLARPGLQADCACKGNTYTGLYNVNDSLPKRIDFVLYNEVHAYPVSYIADGDNMGHTTLPSDHVPVVTEMMLK